MSFPPSPLHPQASDPCHGVWTFSTCSFSIFSLPFVEFIFRGKKIFWIFSFLFAYPSNRSLATIPGDGPLAWREISKDYQEAESVTQCPLGWLRLRWAHPMQWFIGAKLVPSQTQAMLQSPIWSHSNHYLLIFISKHSKALMFSQNESIKQTNKN